MGEAPSSAPPVVGSYDVVFLPPFFLDKEILPYGNYKVGAGRLSEEW